MKLSITTCVFSCVLSTAILSKHQCITAMTTETKAPKGKKGKTTETKAPKGKKSKSNKSAERAITMWWVLFNKPSACITDPESDIKCGVPDIFANAVGGTNNPNIAIINASGGISDSNGFLRLAAALYKTDSCKLDLEGDNGHNVWGGPSKLYDGVQLYDGSSIGYCPADGEVTEVHIYIRDNGPVTENKIKQLTTGVAPSCSQAGGSNLCADIGAVAFPPMSEDGLMTKDIGHFPIFPPGCADAEACEENVEMVQLTAESGNEMTLVRTGDALQVVAEITVPKV